MSLPFIDRHEAWVAADAHAVFDALVALLQMRSRFMQRGIGRLLMRVLRGAWAADQAGVGPVLAGLPVRRYDPPRALVLAGRHRFAVYTMPFQISDPGRGRRSWRWIPMRTSWAPLAITS